MTAIVHDRFAALAAGEFVGPSIEEAFPEWENGQPAESGSESVIPWWVYLNPLLAPVAITGAAFEYVWPETAERVAETVATTSAELWTAAEETAGSVGDWMWSGLGSLWDTLKWVLLALLVIVVLVALIVLR